MGQTKYRAGGEYIMYFIYFKLAALATLFVLGILYAILGDAGVIVYFAGFTLFLIVGGVIAAGRN